MFWTNTSPLDFRVEELAKEETRMKHTASRTTFIRLHCVISQKTELFTATGVTASNPMYVFDSLTL
jgi:hypothetical protein